MRRLSNRPIVERLPHIAIKDIAKLIPRHNPNITVNPDAYGWRYPGKVMLSMNGIKITDAAIVPQFFRFAWVRTAGKPRPLIICQCRRKAQILYFYSGTPASIAIAPNTSAKGNQRPVEDFGKPPKNALK
jgi:hypothetical protein